MDSKRVTTAVAGTILKIVIAAFVIVVVYKGAVGAYDYGFRVFAEPPMEEAPGRIVNVVITEGISAAEVGDILKDNGLIRNAKLFSMQEILSEYKDKIRPGAYELNTSMTAQEMLAVIASEPETEAGEDAVTDGQDTTDETAPVTTEPETVSEETETAQ